VQGDYTSAIGGTQSTPPGDRCGHWCRTDRSISCAFPFDELDRFHSLLRALGNQQK